MKNYNLFKIIRKKEYHGINSRDLLDTFALAFNNLGANGQKYLNNIKSGHF